MTANGTTAQPAGIESRIRKLRDLDLAGKVKILIHGASGSGKTWAAAGAYRALVAITEGQGLLQARLSNPDNDAIHVSNMGDLREVIRLLKKPCECKTDGKADPKCEGCWGSGLALRGLYDSLVVDGLTDIQRFMKHEVETEEGRPAGNKSLREGQIGKDEWQVLAHKMIRFLTILRDLEYNVICTAITEEEQDNFGNVRARPALQGQAKGVVGQFFNIVGHLQAKPGEGDDELVRLVRFTAPPNTITAKDVPGLVGVHPPDVNDWIDKVNNHLRTKEQEAK